MANNKQRLIEAGADLFHTKGYSSSSVEDILAATGVSRSNFYYHFEGKLALARAVARHRIQEYQDRVIGRSLDRRDLPPADRITELFLLLASSQDPDSGRTGCPLGRLCTDLGATDPGIRRMIDRFFRGIRKRFAGLAHEVRPDVSAASADRIAEVALCVLQGSLILSDMRNSPGSLELTGRTLVELMRCPTAQAS